MSLDTEFVSMPMYNVHINAIYILWIYCGYTEYTVAHAYCICMLFGTSSKLLSTSINLTILAACICLRLTLIYAFYTTTVNTKQYFLCRLNR